MSEENTDLWHDMMFCVVTQNGIVGECNAANADDPFRPLLLDNYRTVTKLARRMTGATGVCHTASLYNVKTGAVLKRDIPADTVLLAKRSRRGYGIGEYVRRPVVNLETGEKYESVSEAARATGIPRNAVTEVLTGKRKPSPGRDFAYAVVKSRIGYDRD